MILYEFALSILTIAFIPKLIYQKLRYGKYKNFLANRSGKNIPDIQKGNRPLIWIHAVSVGETKAIAPLAKMLHDSALNPLILVTNTTETGHEEAMRCMPFAVSHQFLPFDFSCIIRPVVRKIRPDIVILSESDFWYNFLDEAKQCGAKIFLANGKISDKTAERLKLVPSFAKKSLSLLEHAYVQSQDYAKTFESLGLAAKQITVTGNIKLDTVPPKSDPEFLKSFIGDSPLIVAGSTHEGEESLVLATYLKLLPQFPNLKLVVVPRHPERFDHVAKLLQSSGKRVMRYSEKEDSEAQICLVDKMGLLNLCYSKATMALVCGSFVPGIGGHNIFEPAHYKKAILFGPFMHTQKDFVALFSGQNAAIQTNAEKLYEEIKELLEKPQECILKGERGYEILNNSRGATQKTYDLLISHCS